MKVIVNIRTDFPTKFGIPRQSGIVAELKGRIVFEKEFRDPSALRGLEEFSHIWVLWEFSKSKGEKWSPTVRPPLLGPCKLLFIELPVKFPLCFLTVVMLHSRFKELWQAETCLFKWILWKCNISFLTPVCISIQTQ